MSFRESTTPLLRPDQIDGIKQDLKGIEATLNAPPHLRNQIVDQGMMRKQAQGLQKMLETQSPKPYDASEIDAAMRRKEELEKSIVIGMPTEKEMRRNPPGAVGKNIAWEKAKKSECLELKNVLKRLRASGHLPDSLADGDDLCNIERYRPKKTAQELNMDNSQIEGKSIHLNSARSVVINDEEKALLEQIDPELAGRLATSSPEVRAGIKAYLNDITTPTEKPLCGAQKIAGGICEAVVKNEGERCHHHKD